MLSSKTLFPRSAAASVPGNSRASNQSLANHLLTRIPLDPFAYHFPPKAHNGIGKDERATAL